METENKELAVRTNDKSPIYTDGLEEGIRCAMCTNPMANDRGCDGGCVVNESMYQNVLNVIKKHMLERQPCDDCISRQAVLDQAVDYGSNTYLIPVNSVKVLPSVTPKVKDLSPVKPQPETAHWIKYQKPWGWYAGMEML